MKPARYYNFPNSLGDFLLTSQLIAKQHLEHAERVALHTGQALVAVLIEQALLSEEVLVSTLTQRLGLQRLHVASLEFDPEALRELPINIADSHHVFPARLYQRGHTRLMQLAMADPLDWRAVDEVSFYSGCEVDLAVATYSEISRAIEKGYRSATTRVIARHVVAALESDPEQSGLEDLKTSTLDPDLSQALQLAHRFDALLRLLFRRGVITERDYLAELEGTPDDESEPSGS